MSDLFIKFADNETNILSNISYTLNTDEFLVSEVIRNVCDRLDYNIIICITILFTFYLFINIIIPRAERGFDKDTYHILKPLFDFIYSIIEFSALGLSVFVLGLGIYQYGIPTWQIIYFSLLFILILPIIFLDLGKYLIEIYKKYKK